MFAALSRSASVTVFRRSIEIPAGQLTDTVVWPL